MSVPWQPGVSIAYAFILQRFALQCIVECRSSTLWSTLHPTSDKCAEIPRERLQLPTTPTEETAPLIDKLDVIARPI